jgi:hypothetical protein
MQPPDNFTVPIPVEGDQLHTSESPFCFADPNCPCHEDRELIASVADDVTNGLLTPEEATRLVSGETI